MTHAPALPLTWLNPAGDPCVLLVHGFAGTPAMWTEVAAALPAAWAIGAVALPGHHPEAPDVRDFGEAVDALEGALASCARGAVHLVGYSLGARLCLALLSRGRASVASAVLVGCNPGLASSDERDARRESDASWAALLRARGTQEFLAAWEAQPLFASQRRVAPERREAQRQARLGHDPLRLAQAMEAMSLGAMPDHWPAIDTLDTSVLWIAGQEDPKFLEVARRAAARCPTAALHVVADCGHNPALEQPAALAERITSFVVGHRG